MALLLEEQRRGNGAQMTLVASADGFTDRREEEGDKNLDLPHPNPIIEGVWKRVLREIDGEIDLCSLRVRFEGSLASDLEDNLLRVVVRADEDEINAARGDRSPAARTGPTLLRTSRSPRQNLTLGYRDEAPASRLLVTSLSAQGGITRTGAPHAKISPRGRNSRL